MPVTVYRSVGSSTSTAVIWFIVSVPVLSELIADVNPSVSTDGQVLDDRLLLRELDAAEREDDLDDHRQRQRDRRDRERDGGVEQRRPRLPAVEAEREHDDHRQPGRADDPQRQRVHLLRQRRLFRSPSPRACARSSRPASRRRCRSRSHAAAVRDRRVHERHVRLVARRRARRRPASSRPSPTGTLSPVSADSSIWSDARRDDPAVRGHLVAGRDQHDVADDELLGRDLRPRRRRAARARSPPSSTSARSSRSRPCPAWRRPTTALTSVITSSTTAVRPFLDRERDDRRTDEDQLHVARVLAQEPASVDGGFSAGSAFGPSRVEPLRRPRPPRGPGRGRRRARACDAPVERVPALLGERRPARRRPSPARLERVGARRPSGACASSVVLDLLQLRAASRRSPSG